MEVAAAVPGGLEPEAAELRRDILRGDGSAAGAGRPTFERVIGEEAKVGLQHGGAHARCQARRPARRLRRERGAHQQGRDEQSAPEDMVTHR